MRLRGLRLQMLVHYICNSEVRVGTFRRTDQDTRSRKSATADCQHTKQAVLCGYSVTLGASTWPPFLSSSRIQAGASRGGDRVEKSEAGLSRIPRRSAAVEFSRVTGFPGRGGPQTDVIALNSIHAFSKEKSRRRETVYLYRQGRHTPPLTPLSM